jgi:hypothetical protein
VIDPIGIRLGEDMARGCVVASLRAPSNNGLGGRWSVLEEKPL